MEKPVTTTDKLLELISRESAHDSAHMAAIMMLMAAETKRDVDFPERARSWFDASIGSLLPQGESEDDWHKKQMIDARAHFQKLLLSAKKKADEMKSATTPQPPPKSWWKKLFGQ